MLPPHSNDLSVIAAFHHITRSDSPPLSVSVNELLLEQAVLHLGSLILMDCDWLFLVAAMFPARTDHPPPAWKLSRCTLLQIAMANTFLLVCESRCISDWFLCSELPQNRYRPLNCLWYVCPRSARLPPVCFPDCTRKLILILNPFAIRCWILPFVPGDASSNSPQWLLQSVIASHVDSEKMRRPSHSRNDTKKHLFLMLS